MAITRHEVLALGKAFHEVTARAGSAAEQAWFFLCPESRIFLLHGEDVTLQANHESHARLTDERHILSEQWEITSLRDSPERARALDHELADGSIAFFEVRIFIGPGSGPDASNHSPVPPNSQPSTSRQLLSRSWRRLQLA